MSSFHLRFLSGTTNSNEVYLFNGADKIIGRRGSGARRATHPKGPATIKIALARGEERGQKGKVIRDGERPKE